MHAIFLARMLTHSYIVDCCTDLYKRLESSRMKTKCFYGTCSSLVEICSFLKIKSILRTEFQKPSIHFIDLFSHPYDLRLCVKSFVGSVWERASWRELVKFLLIEKKWSCRCANMKKSFICRVKLDFLEGPGVCSMGCSGTMEPRLA